ncbi:hypothetical protein MATL_G00011330 [Megalops atlanticus]|uniref:Carbonic anhydrase n=1 Tax=Megalops atlanticus TaxID=7932 RepID=A0A9D3TEH1_MEGAT|nr:hypothetical protein MATL_G00011330 [Megalops atlanticus]
MQMFQTALLEFVYLSLCIVAVTGSAGESHGSQTTSAPLPNSNHEWCYHDCDNNPSQWYHIPNSDCGGLRQSPINIDTSKLTVDPNLLEFIFTNFSNPHSMKLLHNTGHTVKCELEEGMVEIEGGGLHHQYSTIQFHFHWGNTDENSNGSEHSVDSKRYPMEMHIVSLRKGLSVDQAKADPEGIAVLGFFIDVIEENKETPEIWKNFTSYLMNITEKDSTVEIYDKISIMDLLGEVNLTTFYRYNGSLTTPECNEAVVWTVFQQPIKISKDLIKLFPQTMNYHDVYRPSQHLNCREVYASPAIQHNAMQEHSWCYDDHCEYSPSLWDKLPDSRCGGARQSPINIDTQNVTYNPNLNNFTFTNFSNPHSMKYLINTGHTVKCVLEEGMVEIEGGGLHHQYSTIQFHFHWGNTDENSNGSEHSVDSKRYPMEMHIVSLRKEFCVEQAKRDSEGIAVLGFFIEVTDDDDKPQSWKTLTSYLHQIKEKDSTVFINESISIDDLLGDVDRSTYYRYEGSLTTPECNEAVLWTVFKQPVRVSKNLVKMFPSSMGYYDVYRSTQPLHNRNIYTSTAPASPAPFPLLLLLCLGLVGAK